jgi:Fur family zinc uptake transcriptional regulator
MTPAKAHQPHDHLTCIADALSRAEALCRERGARMTALRRRILELVWASHSPIGAYAILDRLRAEDTRTAQPPTVYRALEFLLEQGLIHRIESLNAFVGCDHPEQRHVTQFLICTECGAAMELADPSILSLVKESAGVSGFAVARLNMEALGRCPACQQVTTRRLAARHA